MIPVITAINIFFSVKPPDVRRTHTSQIQTTPKRAVPMVAEAFITNANLTKNPQISARISKKNLINRLLGRY